jgi:hypothetical protein
MQDYENHNIRGTPGMRSSATTSCLVAATICAGVAAVAAIAIAKEPAGSPVPSAASPAPVPKEDLEKLAKTEAADFQRTCTNDFHLPFGRKLIFSLDGTRAYAILPVSRTLGGDNPEHRGLAPERKLIAYEIQLASASAVPQFGLRNTLAADLMVTIDPMGFSSGMAAVVSEPAFANCARGEMELVSGVSNASGPVRRKGFFGIVPFNRIPVLFEPLTRSLLQLDTNTMQSRALSKVEPGSHAIHVDPLAGKFTQWNEKKRTLTTISSSANASRRMIKVKEGFQILQHMGRFAALQISGPKNSITIHEIRSWTGVTKDGEFNFKLPVANSVTQAHVWPNFDRKIALVQGRTDDVRRRWQKVFLVDYGEGRVIREFSTKGVDYFGDVGISPNTKTIVLVHMNGAQSVADKIMIVDLSKGTTKEVTLSVP